MTEISTPSEDFSFERGHRDYGTSITGMAFALEVLSYVESINSYKGIDHEYETSQPPRQD
jgi:hypothetical protein